MKFAAILLGLLLMVSFTEQQLQQTGAEIPLDSESELCKDLSDMINTTSAHIRSHKNKTIQVAGLREQLNTAITEEEELGNKVRNLTTNIQKTRMTCTGFLPMDCCQIKVLNSSAETRLYEIKDPCSGDGVFNYAKIRVRCDMETDGGGWIVIQRRIANGTVNFYRNWEDYVNGFGDLDGEFWIGLRNIHYFTEQQKVELQVAVWNDDEKITWSYSTFNVASAKSKYHLIISGGTGDSLTDALTYSNGRYFSTFDRDNIGYRYTNCASAYQGGWWYYRSRYSYRLCTNANLNGRHKSSGLSESSVARLYWSSPGNTYANSEMKIRSRTCGLSG